MKKRIVAAAVITIGVLGIVFYLRPGETPKAGRTIASVPEPQRRPQQEQRDRKIRTAVHLHIHHHSVSGGPEGYLPAQIKTAYKIDQSVGTGVGQTIALIEAMGNPNIQNDINVFSAQFQIPSTTVQIYYPQGQPTSFDPTWALETSLDVEWAHAIAPGAKIIVVAALEDTYDDLFAAVDDAVSLGANVISMSWGSGEFPSETQYDFHFDTSKATFFASAGDSGAGVSWPAASSQVIGVGGTTLPLDSSGNLTSPETAWAGSGGGQSIYEAEPPFQNGVQTSGYRTVPDVSYNADPSTGFAVYDSVPYNGNTGWIQVGGTSAGAPQWAALFALANVTRPAQGPSPLPALYSFANSANKGLYLHDVLSGCDGSSSQNCAHNGYDLVTGLGTPVTDPLISALWGVAAPTPVPTPSPTAKPTPKPTPVPTPKPTSSVVSFSLINASNGQAISGFNPIANGAVITLSKLSSKNISIRANTTPSQVGSIGFKLDSNYTHTENVLPYSLCGDETTSYSPCTQLNVIGSHTLTGTPYSGTNLTGTKGAPLTITFKVAR